MDRRGFASSGRTVVGSPRPPSFRSSQFHRSIQSVSPTVGRVSDAFHVSMAKPSPVEDLFFSFPFPPPPSRPRRCPSPFPGWCTGLNDPGGIPPPVSSPLALEGTDPWVLHPGEPDGLSQSKGDGFGSVRKGGKGPRWIHEWISCHPPPAIHVAPPQSSTSTSHRTRSCSYHRHGNRPPLRRVPCAWNRTPQPRGTPAARHPRSTPASSCVHRHLGDAGRDRNHRVSRRHLHLGCC